MTAILAINEEEAKVTPGGEPNDEGEQETSGD